VRSHPEMLEKNQPTTTRLRGDEADVAGEETPEEGAASATPKPRREPALLGRVGLDPDYSQSLGRKSDQVPLGPSGREE
jgi:hypothetical protein